MLSFVAFQLPLLKYIAHLEVWRYTPTGGIESLSVKIKSHENKLKVTANKGKTGVNSKLLVTVGNEASLSLINAPPE